MDHVEHENWARPLSIGSLKSQDIISFMITTGYLNSEDMISQVKFMWWILYWYYVMFMVEIHSFVKPL